MQLRPWRKVAVVATLPLCFLWASFPWRLSPREFDAEVGGQNATPSDKPTTLTVLTWNLAYLYGVGSEGTDDYQPASLERYQQNLEKAALTIKESGADVVLLQEVDFDSSRSHGVDQLAELSRLTGLGFMARAESWNVNYVPFPAWPLQRQFGQVLSGGGVLSRWPIIANHVQLLPKPINKAWWYNLFYLFRYFQDVTIEVEGRQLQFVNLHLEAFDLETKHVQATMLAKKVKREKPDFVGGDFNTLPDNALKRSGFPNPKDVYEGDKTFVELKGMGYPEAVGEGNLAREESWFTFPSNRPDRRLDYIFSAPKWAIIRAEVVQSPHPEVSDHLPFKAVYQFLRPEFIKD